MKRWYCCECGDGILAPSYVPQRDKRRWCLECSLTSSSHFMVKRYRAASLAKAQEMKQKELALEARQRARQVAEDIEKAFKPSGRKQIALPR